MKRFLQKLESRCTIVLKCIIQKLKLTQYRGLFAGFPMTTINAEFQNKEF
jgi:hypothetical protein